MTSKEKSKRKKYHQQVGSRGCCKLEGGRTHVSEGPKPPARDHTRHPYQTQPSRGAVRARDARGQGNGVQHGDEVQRKNDGRETSTGGKQWRGGEHTSGRRVERPCSSAPSSSSPWCSPSVKVCINKPSHGHGRATGVREELGLQREGWGGGQHLSNLKQRGPKTHKPPTPNDCRTQPSLAGEHSGKLQRTSGAHQKKGVQASQGACRVGERHGKVNQPQTRPTIPPSFTNTSLQDVGGNNQGIVHAHNITHKHTTCGVCVLHDGPTCRSSSVSQYDSIVWLCQWGGRGEKSKVRKVQKEKTRVPLHNPTWTVWYWTKIGRIYPSYLEAVCRQPQACIVEHGCARVWAQ